VQRHAVDVGDATRAWVKYDRDDTGGGSVDGDDDAIVFFARAGYCEF
jgi:hypothetical protein